MNITADLYSPLRHLLLFPFHRGGNWSSEIHLPGVPLSLKIWTKIRIQIYLQNISPLHQSTRFLFVCLFSMKKKSTLLNSSRRSAITRRSFLEMNPADRSRWHRILGVVTIRSMMQSEIPTVLKRSAQETSVRMIGVFRLCSQSMRTGKKTVVPKTSQWFCFQPNPSP